MTVSKMKQRNVVSIWFLVYHLFHIKEPRASDIFGLQRVRLDKEKLLRSRLTNPLCVSVRIVCQTVHSNILKKFKFEFTLATLPLASSKASKPLVLKFSLITMIPPSAFSTTLHR
ncbi:hypothetical protein MN608_09313 [Microdochium nivale]|nr:hypothetical protein MN608_09313 [Microdochium nivale]